MTSPFFGENKSSWTDMSDYVVHFARDYEQKSAYENVLSILASRVIKAKNPFGLVREKAPDPKSQRVVCFSEIPLHRLRRLAEARSEYGVVFRKDFVIHRGANPIMYAYKDHDVTAALKKIAKGAKKDPDHPIWTITPFVDAPGKYGNSTYFFEWEREWRKIGHFKFSEDDVAFLIIPESSHKAARGFFDNAKIENLGPCYDCPFIDPFWSLKMIKPLLPTYAEESES
ncbi:abortive infection system antitoxin AbiGi family protein [Bradyrhizobium sp. CCBAU 51765]|uniref:abortive infection system antitoxin AbiGi family protein n=1 Tax=Bradyrhizobium sp. CCBAU 51765 TaxID=1325102 RepID=UPI0018873E35|nr:abortive infection system antitoxin AbiGi family protein [Bradyrhizobium sp. CCBAU 51765]QOZ07512.1 hypothetical protein XH96_08215 [Bradyrhizobium sp. CCBAU 51765]